MQQLVDDRRRVATRLGALIVLYLAVDPFYDALAVSPLNASFFGVRASDWFALVFLLAFAYFLFFQKVRIFYLDLYGLSIIVLACYRFLVDLAYDDIRAGEDVPRMLLNFLLYASSLVAAVSRRKLFFACALSLIVYGASAALQVASDGLSVRASAIFLNPNFLAFNALNLVVLFRLCGTETSWARMGAILSVALIVLSKTRAVMFSMLFFVFAVRSNLVRFVLGLLAIGFAFFGGAEWARMAGHVDDFWSFDGRVPIWLAIFERFSDFDFIFGSGTDVLRRLEVFVMYDDTGASSGYLRAQNNYLQTLVEVGLVGLGIWVAGVVAYWFRLVNSSKWNTNWRIGAAFLSSLLTLQVFENDIFVNPTVSIILGLLLSKSFLRKR